MNRSLEAIRAPRRSRCMGWVGHDLGMKSRVHPNYKTKYRVSNWADYDRALVRRGGITLWISQDAIGSWKPAPTGLRGAQRKFSDHAIETALTLRLVFKLPLRKAEGFLRSVVENTFFRYKTIIGHKLRARHPPTQKAEAIIACNIPNRMIALGKPEAFAIAD